MEQLSEATDLGNTWCVLGCKKAHQLDVSEKQEDDRSWYTVVRNLDITPSALI